MELSRMSVLITKMIDIEYRQYNDNDNECLDIIQLKNICNLYKTKGSSTNSISLHSIVFSSPEFQKINKTSQKKQIDILKTPEFQKKYSFFIRVIFCCLKISITIFDIKDNVITMKNNYQLIKALELGKKKLIEQHMNILKQQHKHISQKINPDYDEYFHDYLIKVKLIDKISSSITKLIDTNILTKTDNLFSLVLPYFYKYDEFIEEYN
jgi:hypothetical protein